VETVIKYSSTVTAWWNFACFLSYLNYIFCLEQVHKFSVLI
jgi:hypothetical protein